MTPWTIQSKDVWSRGDSLGSRCSSLVVVPGCLIAVAGCGAWAFSGCGSRGGSLVVVHGHLIVVAGCRAWLFSGCGARASHCVAGCGAGLQGLGSVVVVHGFSCSAAYGILPD